MSLVALCLTLTLPGVILLQWSAGFRLPGAIGALMSPIYLLLAMWELVRYQRGWRVLLALAVAAVATSVAWGTMIAYGFGELH